MNDLIEKIKLKKKLILIIFNVCVFIYLDFKFILGPQFRAISSLNPQIRALRDDIKSVKSDLSILKELTARLQVLKKKAETYSGWIIPPEHIPSLLEEISRIAKSQDIKIMQIKTQKNQDAKPVAKIDAAQYYPLGVSLEMRASYQSLINFLNSLENASIFMKVTGCDISPNTGDFYYHRIKLIIATYVVYKS